MSSSGYFLFLQNMIDPGHRYTFLLKHLHNREFLAEIPNDDNRASDGISLRDLYSHDEAINRPCTVLEMLIALAKRMSFDLEGGPYETSLEECFWVFMENLGLDIFSNTEYKLHSGTYEVEFILDNWLNREYDFDGNGGLFPLKMAKDDQRLVEIWYQMSAYIIENYPI